MSIRLFILALFFAMLGCAEPEPEPEPEFPEPRDPLPDPQMPEGADAGARVVHAVAPFELDGSEETMTCYSWTVDNDEPLYVQKVEFQNGGSFHHSNWFVVPEDVYPGADGFWPCDERDFEDVSAALAGTVLFAQSTQAQQESMAFTEGATIRIPARSKIVAGVHLLNLGPDARDTSAWLSMDVIHPGLVDTVLSPMMLSYRDLEIPPTSQARFQGECVGGSLGSPDFSLHYVLPHYHRAGTRATLDVLHDRGLESVLDHRGFGASPMGRSFDPPLEISSLDGIFFSCGYDNPHDETLTWGIGINEMCVVLAYTDSSDVLIGGVEAGAPSAVRDDEDGEPLTAALCRTVAVPRSNAYDLPIRAEISGPLVVPAADGPAPEPPTCSDVEVVGDGSAPTFAEVRDRVFQPWCSFSSCHGEAGAGGLGLDSADELVGVGSSWVGLPRVDPGDPEGSVLYRLLSECEPEFDGTLARHMPAGSPTLLEPGLVRLVRTWIEAGAPV